jgi:hypothetical protein
VDGGVVGKHRPNAASGPNLAECLLKNVPIQAAILPLTAARPLNQVRIAQNFPVVTKQGKADPSAPGKICPAKLVFVREQLHQLQARRVRQSAENSCAMFKT